MDSRTAAYDAAKRFVYCDAPIGKTVDAMICRKVLSGDRLNEYPQNMEAGENNREASKIFATYSNFNIVPGA